jgi:uncharacterized protein YjiS (DUF1127 family)
MLRMSNRLIGRNRVANQCRPDTLFDGSFPRNVPAVIRTWVARSDERRALRELEDHDLADIGMSRAQALREVRKWFWQR